LLSGCAAPEAPSATFTTESSEVSVFGIDETTDVDSLIDVTGLDPAVKDTLLRLKGQQIAVIKLNTTPRLPLTGTGVQAPASGEPGLHLSWVTTLTESQNGATYAYPLGTGAAWAQPIEMTRVYVVAPSDVNFRVSYPKLGTKRSGFARYSTRYSSGFEPRILDYVDTAAYAVDDAFGQMPGSAAWQPGSRPRYGEWTRVWRATYTQSNSTEDILITVSPNRHIGFRASLRQAGPGSALAVGIPVAILFWVLAWYLLVPRLADKDTDTRGLWRMSLTYMFWNLGAFLPGLILYVLLYFGVRAVPLLSAAVIFGGISVLIFTIRHIHRLAASRGKALKIFAAVTGASGGAYLLFALGCAWLVGAL